MFIREGNKKEFKETIDFDVTDFQTYLNTILHQWLKTLTMFGYTLVPFFFILDYFTVPASLLLTFGMLRLASVIIILTQYFIIRQTKPGAYSYIHGYFISINVGGIIAVMTYLLGGFSSGYYAGLNLVMVAVNMLLPWKPVNSAVNSVIIIGMYISINLIRGVGNDLVTAVNHLFFMLGTGIISIGINYVKNKLERKEFYLRAELKKTRDALWGEMEIAKRIQTALLPHKESISCHSNQQIGCYSIAAVMIPADEVGGDYYDIIETKKGERWIAIGDVTGHGVESGLIMMMTQTSIYSIVDNTVGYNPSVILNAINNVIKENISRLGADRYVAISLIRLSDTQMVVAGKHQDILIYRAATGEVDTITTDGTWVGIYDKLKKHTSDIIVPIDIGDIVLLFTDGITEATDKNGLMYGQDRLISKFRSHNDLQVNEILQRIITDVSAFWEKQYDDVTALVIRRDQ